MANEEHAGPPDGGLFDSAEAAALSGWESTPSAHARVIGVEPGDKFDGVYVTIQVDGRPDFHDREVTACVRVPDGRWSPTWSAGL